MSGALTYLHKRAQSHSPAHSPSLVPAEGTTFQIQSAQPHPSRCSPRTERYSASWVYRSVLLMTGFGKILYQIILWTWKCTAGPPGCLCVEPHLYPFLPILHILCSCQLHLQFWPEKYFSNIPHCWPQRQCFFRFPACRNVIRMWRFSDNLTHLNLPLCREFSIPTETAVVPLETGSLLGPRLISLA